MPGDLETVSGKLDTVLACPYVLLCHSKILVKRKDFKVLHVDSDCDFLTAVNDLIIKLLY